MITSTWMVAPVALVTLIRHAESAANVERVLQGITDAPLSQLGEQQLVDLEAAWRPDAQTQVNAFALPRPTLVVSSPIGRAVRTSGAVARAYGIGEVPASDKTTHRSRVLAPPPHEPHAYVLTDAGLAERNFGAAECTRRSKVVSEFPRPPLKDIGKAESVSAFQQRVRAAGKKWVAWIAQVASNAPQGVVVTENKTQRHLEAEVFLTAPTSPTAVPADAAKCPARTTHTTSETDNTTQSRCAPTSNGAAPASSKATSREEKVAVYAVRSNVARSNDAALQGPDTTGTASEPNTTAPAAMPHLVLVSHGQWINAFLSEQCPELRTGKDAFYIQSTNTGVFTMEVHKPHAGAPRLHLVRHNDTSHLGDTSHRTTKRARHSQKTTLTSLWMRP